MTMIETAAIYAIAIMMVADPKPTNRLAAETVTYISKPKYDDSITCQRMAMSFNQRRGWRFVGKPNTAFQGIKGVVVGAWCIVPVKKAASNEIKK